LPSYPRIGCFQVITVADVTRIRVKVPVT